MKHLKQTLIVVLTLMILLGGTGCMNVEGNNPGSTLPKVEVEKTAEEVKEMVLQHLADKYGKQFRCVTMREPYALSDRYVFICSEAEKLSERDQFKAFYTPDGEPLIQDGYFGFALGHLVTDEVNNFDSVAGKKVKVFAEFFMGVFPEELKQGATLADAVSAMGNVDSYIYVFSDTPLDIEQMVKESKSLGLSGWIYCYQLDKKDFESVSTETYGEVVSNVIVKKVKPIAYSEIEIK